MQIEKYKKIIFHPLVLAIAIFLLVHIFNISRFEFLAEKDSYGWLLKYEDNLRYDVINDYRQLFSSLVISLHHLTGLQLFDIFKYVMPLFFLTAFVPLWLLARNLKVKFFQFLILVSILGSATIILQMESIRPQIMAMFFLYFALGISTIAKKEENYVFSMFLLGILAAVGSLFHRVFAIFLLVWIFYFLYSYRKTILKNKLKFSVLALLLIPWLEKIEARNMVLKAFTSLREIFEKIFIHPQLNFEFPAFYTNIDDVQMGWKNLEGVAKYYAFYAGPFFIFLLVLIVIFFIFSKKFREYVEKNARKNEFLFVYLLISFFIFIAEFLPRIGNVAYLPDRSWVFLGILLILPLYLLFDYLEREFSKKTVIDFSLIFCLFLFISVSGGIYVNNSLKNIIPSYKMGSYEWIKNNTEPGSLIFSFEYKNALKYHSGRKVLSIDQEILKNGDTDRLLNVLKLENKNKFDEALYMQNLEELNNKLNETKRIIKQKEYSFDELFSRTRETKIKASVLFSQINSSTNLDFDKGVYIFFAKDGNSNPYGGRMYSSGYCSNLDQDDTGLLSNNPQYFQKIYDTENVKIWKFIPESI